MKIRNVQIIMALKPFFMSAVFQYFLILQKDFPRNTVNEPVLHLNCLQELSAETKISQDTTKCPRSFYFLCDMLWVKIINRQVNLISLENNMMLQLKYENIPIRMQGF